MGAKEDYPNVTWDSAIDDAERMIQELRKQIRRLKLSVKSFEYFKEQGIPVPHPDE